VKKSEDVTFILSLTATKTLLIDFDFKLICEVFDDFHWLKSTLVFSNKLIVEDD